MVSPHMRVFVTGGNGFIGSRVVRQLLREGHQVRCLLRETSKTDRIDGLEFETYIGEVRSPDSLLRGVAGCDAAVHLAAVSSWNDMGSSLFEEVNVTGSTNLFEACKTAGNLRCVFVSSVAAVNGSRRPVLFDESSPFELAQSSLRYAVSKHKAELSAGAYVASGVPIVIVNPVEVYGPDDTELVSAGNILDVLKSYPAFACKGGTGIAHVDDVADGIVKALKHGVPGERYILGGDNLTIEEIVRLILQIAGQKKPVVRLPNRLLRISMRAIKNIGLTPPLSPEVLEYATRYFFMDTQKAVRELGYRTRPARDVLAPVIKWLREARYV